MLFADIKGSMDLIEDLDPEEAIVDPALKLMMEAVQRYGGYVAQSTGDGVFALFGAPVAYEDHPQRALYAALRMLDELKRYSDRIRAEGRLPIQARVGSERVGEVRCDRSLLAKVAPNMRPLVTRPASQRGCKHLRGHGPALPVVHEGIRAL